MVLGMSIEMFTQLHVLISLVGLVSGVGVLYQMVRRVPYNARLHSVFLWSTILTSVTGFFFPFSTFNPPHVVGAISLAVLAVTMLALYVGKLQGKWRWLYVVTATIAFYLNAFVGVVQAFQKLEPLNIWAPTQTEPPFIAAQLALILVFVIYGYLAVKRFQR